jgi:hypothetical protein
MWSFLHKFQRNQIGTYPKSKDEENADSAPRQFANSYRDYLWKNLPQFHEGTARLGNKEGRAPVTVSKQIIEVVPFR